MTSIHSPLNEEKRKEYAGKVDEDYFIVEPNGWRLNMDARNVEDGRIWAVVDSVFPLEEGVKEFESLAERHTVGKIVLKVAD